MSGELEEALQVASREDKCRSVDQWMAAQRIVLPDVGIDDEFHVMLWISDERESGDGARRDLQVLRESLG